MPAPESVSRLPGLATRCPISRAPAPPGARSREGAVGGGTAPGRCLLPLTRTPKCVKWQTYVYVITVKGTILMFYVRDTKIYIYN